MKPLKLYAYLLLLVLLASCQKYTFTPAPAPPAPGPGFSDEVTLCAPYNNNLIVAGNFTTLFNNSKGLAEWNGTTWQDLSGVINPGGGQVSINALTTYNSSLIVCGTLYPATGSAAYEVVQWNGTTAQNLGTLNMVTNPYVYTDYSTDVGSAVVFNNNLIVAGYFQTAGGVSVNSIAQWNGTAWTNIGGNIPVYNKPAISALAVYNGTLIAGGSFDTIGNQPIQDIAQWNGTAWTSLVSSCNGQVTGLTVNNGNLIVTGFFTSINGVSAAGIAQFNGTNWTALNVKNTYYTLYQFTGYNGQLCFINSYDSTVNEYSTSGVVTTCGQASSTKETVARYYSVGYNNPLINALCVYNGNLVAGGWFTSINGVNVTNDIAQWNGTTWAPIQ